MLWASAAARDVWCLVCEVTVSFNLTKVFFHPRGEERWGKSHWEQGVTCTSPGAPLVPELGSSDRQLDLEHAGAQAPSLLGDGDF